jgi:TonB family protein
MACREYTEILSTYVDDELKPLERLRVEAHLRGCASCRRYLRQVRHATELLHGLDRLQAPAFAVRRGRDIALGDKARGWDRLRGGLTPRPRQISLRPVVLAGLAFVLALIVSQGFNRVVGPPPGPAPSPAPEEQRAAGRLPGTLSPDQLSDSQKAEIARRYVEAHPESASGQVETAAADPASPPSRDGAPAGSTAAPPALQPEATGQNAPRPLMASGNGDTETEALPGVRAPGAEPMPVGPTPSDGLAPPTPREETRIADGGVSPEPATLVVIGAPAVPAEPSTPAAISEQEAADGRSAAPAAGGSSRRHEGWSEATDLDTTLRAVLVVSQGDDGELAAAFRGAEGEAGLNRFEEDSLLGAEAAPSLEEQLPPPEPDPETGIAPPLAVFQPVPDLGERLREAHRRDVLSPLALRLLVDEEGAVAAVTPLSSSGLGWLDRAVADAVKGWEFRPAEQDGEPLPVVVELVVEFDLE